MKILISPREWLEIRNLAWRVLEENSSLSTEALSEIIADRISTEFLQKDKT